MRILHGHCRAILLALIWTGVGLFDLSACADWPQWGGPDRNNVSQETGLLKEWPEGGPQRLWLFRDCGQGFSGPAIVGGRVYTMGARGETEYVIAIRAGTGEEIWSTEIGPIFADPYDRPGPRSTPTIDEGRAYVLGGNGDLACIDTESGEAIWRTSMSDLGGNVPPWGWCESLLVRGDKLICAPGGSENAIVALDKTTGRLAWRVNDVPQGAALIRNADQNECIHVLDENVVGFNANNGNLLWQHPLGLHKSTTTIPVPLVYRDQIVLSLTPFFSGTVLLRGNSSPTPAVSGDEDQTKRMDGSLVVVGKHLYGCESGFFCHDLEEGRELWRNREMSKGCAIYADGRLYCLDRGKREVVLVEASPEDWYEHGRFSLEEVYGKAGELVLTYPAISDGRLYIRHQENLYCYNISASGELPTYVEERSDLAANSQNAIAKPRPPTSAETTTSLTAEEWQTYFDAGLEAKKRGDWADAARLFEWLTNFTDVIDEDQQQDLWIKLSSSYSFADDEAGAASACARHLLWIEEIPNKRHWIALLSLHCAFHLQASGDMSRAEAMYLKATEVPPAEREDENDELFRELAQLYRKQGRYDEADARMIDALTQPKKLYDNQRRANYEELVRLKADQGKAEEATKICDLVEAGKDDFEQYTFPVDLLECRLRTHCAAGDLQQATEVAGELWEAIGGSERKHELEFDQRADIGDALAMLSLTCWENNNRDAAIDWCKKACRLIKDDSIATVHLLEAVDLYSNDLQSQKKDSAGADAAIARMRQILGSIYAPIHLEESDFAKDLLELHK